MTNTLFGYEVPPCAHGRTKVTCPFCKITPSFVHHSHTSLEASIAIHARAPGLRELVYEAIKNSPSGLTDEEIVNSTGLKQNTSRPRRVELASETPPRIRSEGKRKTLSGRNAQVWVVTKADV